MEKLNQRKENEKNKRLVNEYLVILETILKNKEYYPADFYTAAAIIQQTKKIMDANEIKKQRMIFIQLSLERIGDRLFTGTISSTKALKELEERLSKIGKGFGIFS